MSNRLRWTALCTLGMALACGDAGEASSDTEEASGGVPSVHSGAPSIQGTERATDGADTPETSGGTAYDVAIEEDFESWTGGVGRFSMTLPQHSPYADNNTRRSLGGRNCLNIHAPAVVDERYGFSAVEFQLTLAAQTDMSAEDFWIAFDVYVPSETADERISVQYGFYELETYTSIYAYWSSISAGRWFRIAERIRLDTIGFSQVEHDPGDWIFEAVRLRLIHHGGHAKSGDEMSFCIDDLIVSNAPV